MPARRSATSGRTRGWPAGCWASTGRGSEPSGSGLGPRGGLAKGADEPVPILAELTDLGLDPGGDLVDRHEERELALLEGIDHLAIATGDLEDALPVGDELHLGQML